MEFTTKVNPVSIDDNLKEYAEALCIVSVKLVLEGDSPNKIIIYEDALNPANPNVYILIKYKVNSYSFWCIIDSSENIYKVEACSVDRYLKVSTDEITCNGTRMLFWVMPQHCTVGNAQVLLIKEAARQFSSKIDKE